MGYGHEDEAVTKLSQRGRGEVTWAEIDVALLLGILDMLTLSSKPSAQCPKDIDSYQRRKLRQSARVRVWSERAQKNASASVHFLAQVRRNAHRWTGVRPAGAPAFPGIAADSDSHHPGASRFGSVGVKFPGRPTTISGAVQSILPSFLRSTDACAL